MVGMLRNIGDSTPLLFSKLREVGRAFESYQIMVLEGNSVDQTKADLARECPQEDTQCIIEDVENVAHIQGEFVKGRIQHLTKLRQILLKHVKANLAKERYDFVLMYDGDLFEGTNPGFNPPNFFALMGYQVEGAGRPSAVYADQPYDLVCANQMVVDGMYRDTFALRLHKPLNYKSEAFGRHEIYFHGNSLADVGACFSGLAVFTAEAVNSSCDYNMYVDEETCEHVPYVQCLADHGYDQVAVYPPLYNAVNSPRVGPPTGIGATFYPDGVTPPMVELECSNHGHNRTCHRPHLPWTAY